jgi:hypothetical protein
MQMSSHQLGCLYATMNSLRIFWLVSMRSTTPSLHWLLAAPIRSLLVIYIHSCSASSSIQASKVSRCLVVPCLPWLHPVVARITLMATDLVLLHADLASAAAVVMAALCATAALPTSRVGARQQQQLQHALMSSVLEDWPHSQEVLVSV